MPAPASRNERTPLNLPFWSAAAVLWSAVNLEFARKLFPGFGASFWHAFVSAQLRAFLAAVLVVLLSGIIRRRRARWLEPPLLAAFWTAASVYGALAAAHDAFGLGPGETLSILLAGGWVVLRDTGVPIDILALSFAVLLGVLLLGPLLLWKGKARKSVRPMTLVGLAYLSAALIIGEQAYSRLARNQEEWRREQRIMPLYVAAIQPAGLAEYKVKARPFERMDREAAAYPAKRAAKRRDANIFVVVLESVRQDVVNPDNAPNLYRFQSENASYRYSFASGNATMLAWFAIVNSGFPLYFHSMRSLKDNEGSPPLSILKKAGVRIRVFSSPDIGAYLNYRNVMFGQGDKLAEVEDCDLSKDIPKNDRLAIRKLVEALDGGAARGMNLFALFLNSTHATYHWPPDFEPRFKPFLKLDVPGEESRTTYKLRGLSIPDFVGRLNNRYRNSAAFVDVLFGELVGELKARGLYEDSVIIVLGDHGQEFFEHGFIGHSSDLFNEQTRIPLLVKMPGLSKNAGPGPVSQLDVMPTLMDYLGLYDGAERFSDGVSLIRDAAHPVLISAMNGASPPAIFQLANGRFKMEFLLDVDTERATVTAVYDMEDRPSIPGSGTPADYREFLDREFVPSLNATGLLQVNVSR